MEVIFRGKTPYGRLLKKATFREEELREGERA